MKNNGMSLMGVLFIIFLTLKLTNLITWSWWWVTIPLWGGIALFGLFLLFGVILTFISYLLEKRNGS